MHRLFVAPFLALLVLWMHSGCAPQCDGIEVNGVCEKACRDEACPPKAQCVDNICRSECTPGQPCDVGETCAAATTDFGRTGMFCTGPRPDPGDLDKGGRDSAPCSASDDCAQRYGYRCVGAACQLTCEFHGHCGPRGTCTGSDVDTEGTAVRLCEDDGAPRARGQFGTACPNGDECADGFICVGAGPGDADAYCSKQGCESDAECPLGSFCSTELAGRPPCAVNDCGLPSRPTDTDCVPPGDIGAGAAYQCGPVSLVVNVCRHRSFCAPCEADADCMDRPNQVCAKDRSGVKICTVRCQPGGTSCPWGNAATCGLWDPDVGFETCAHRFGSCRGTGLSCEPCLEQEDCPNGWCQEAGFSRERYCVDATIECSCRADTATSCVGGGCPTTPEPGSLLMRCLGGSRYTGTPVFNKCFGAVTDPTEPSKESCWPE